MHTYSQLSQTHYGGIGVITGVGAALAGDGVGAGILLIIIVAGIRLTGTEDIGGDTTRSGITVGAVDLTIWDTITPGAAEECIAWDTATIVLRDMHKALTADTAQWA